MVKHAGQRTLRSVSQLLVREATAFHRVRSRRRSVKRLERQRQHHDDDDDDDEGHTDRPLLGRPLFRVMMLLNVLSLTFPFAPLLLGSLGVQTYLSTDLEHASSTRPFGPTRLIELAFDDVAPLQALDASLPRWARGGAIGGWLVDAEGVDTTTRGKGGGGSVFGGGSKSSWFGRPGKSGSGGATAPSDAATVRVYLPGLALDCLLGIVQGLVLGFDLLARYRRRSNGSSRGGNNGSQPPASVFPALSLLLFAGMCASALPLHCLRDSPLVFEDADVGEDVNGEELSSSSKTFLLFVDVFCTTVAPTFMFLDLLIRTNRLHVSAQWWLAALAVPLLKAPMVWIGVANRSEWWGPIVVGALHVGPLPFYGALFYYIMVDEIRHHRACPHEALWMATSGLPVAVLSAGGALLGRRLTTVTGGRFDTLTCAFLGCRLGMVQYWAYVRARDGVCRRCDDGEEGGEKEDTGLASIAEIQDREKED